MKIATKVINIYDKVISSLNKIINKKTILFAMIIIVILCLIPILRISFYTHPSSDDYGYGSNTINVLEKEGLSGIIKGTVETVKSYYVSWQGTFSAATIMALNPAVWGDDMYFLTTFVIIGMLFIGLYYFFKQGINKLLRSDKATFWIFLLGFFLLAIETLPDKDQGLFWWNGSSYYMLFFSLELIEWGLLIKRYVLNKKTKLDYILLSILIFIIGGGNFVTALQQIIILAFINMYLVFYKKDKSAIPLFIISLISLGISAIAPGNAVRASRLQGMNPFKAILASFYYSAYYAFMWMTPLNIIVIFVLTILLFHTYKNVKIKFRCPLIVALFAFCIFAAEFTPTLYSQSSIGVGRLWNIMYISHLLFSSIVLYYIIGWGREKIISKNVFTDKAFKGINEVIKENAFWIVMIVVALISMNVFDKRENMTTYQTNILIENGYAQKYDEECKERVKILKDDSIKKVEFAPLTVCPKPIFHCEFSDDPEHWLNGPVTKIYNKEYVKVLK